MVTALESGRDDGWVVLVYRVPPKPSRHRVAIWRRLKASGAVYLQDAVCVLPDIGQHRKLFTTLASDVRDAGGEAVVLAAVQVDEVSDEAVRQRFVAERDHDYREVVEQGEVLLFEIDRDRGQDRFSYAALEDVESNLERLRRWLTAITARDFFTGPARLDAEQMLARCAEAVESFATQVADRDGSHRPHEPGNPGGKG